jgi:hypothetical protein
MCGFDQDEFINKDCLCCKCGIKHDLLPLLSVTSEKMRTMIDDEIIEFDTPQCYSLCEKCLKGNCHTIIPKYIYCDLCHTQHDRMFYSDNQGDGLCGKVSQKNTQRLLAGQECMLDGYIIECGYGSCYDAMGDYQDFIKFTSHVLPQNITLGMNICDNCIGQLLKEGVCAQQPLVFSQF